MSTRNQSSFDQCQYEYSLGAICNTFRNCHSKETAGHEFVEPLPLDKGTRAEQLLFLIIRDLPTNKDWLDPDVEREARELLGL